MKTEKSIWISGIIFIFAFTVAFVRVNAISMDGTVYWDGNGGNQLPCPYGAHWVLNPGDGIDAATLYVDSNSYPMTRHGNGSWWADSDQPIDVGITVYAEYQGAGGEEYHILLSHCLEGEPTVTPQPTDTPTSTPTITPTTDPGSPTPTITPTTDPGSPTPTSTGTQPTETPTSPPTTTETPEPTWTATNTPTSPPNPTETPRPPQPAIARASGLYTGTLLGTVDFGGRIFELYQGVNASDGTLLLPSAAKGAALYNGVIWVHRLWRSGWLDISVHDTILINGEKYKVTATNYLPYGIYPEVKDDGSIQYIATCYADNKGNWLGVQLYKLEKK